MLGVYKYCCCCSFKKKCGWSNGAVFGLPNILEFGLHHLLPLQHLLPISLFTQTDKKKSTVNNFTISPHTRRICMNNGEAHTFHSFVIDRNRIFQKPITQNNLSFHMPFRRNVVLRMYVVVAVAVVPACNNYYFSLCAFALGTADLVKRNS